MSEQTDKKFLFTLDEEFTFSCDSTLPCFNTCCRDINIFLTPYDVMRMRRSLWLPSDEFLDKFTIALVGDDGIPLVVLKMKEDKDKTCPFVGAQGCSIYQDRPWSCRMYPVFPVSAEEQEFLIEEKLACHGFRGKKTSTVRQWKKDQDLSKFDLMNDAYKKITLHDYFQNGNKIDPGMTKLVYNTCYDLDAFKRFIFSSRFFDIYDVDVQTIEAMRKDEEELLNFAYRWVEFSLFSEGNIKIKDKEMEKLMKARNPNLS
ncbi:MAG: YkgJ family cysteine cluster protein [Syntrophobacteraceae bacterium]|nr:YkgJ family cysteine cluster protein [Syntrophobacteraceae bacterium]